MGGDAERLVEGRFGDDVGASVQDGLVNRGRVLSVGADGDARVGVRRANLVAVPIEEHEVLGVHDVGEGDESLTCPQGWLHGEDLGEGVRLPDAPVLVLLERALGEFVVIRDIVLKGLTFVLRDRGGRELRSAAWLGT